MKLSGGEYLGGALLAVLLFGACAAAAVLVVRRRLGWLTGAPACLALFVTASAALTVSLLVPGILGVLSQGTAIATALGLAALATRVRPSRSPPVPAESAGQTDEPRWAWALALAGSGAVLAGALAYLWSRSHVPVMATDALTVHLPAVARFLQSGSLWQNVQYGSDLSNGTYPQNGTLMMLAATLPWQSTFLVRFVDAPFLLATAVAVYALARELDAPRPESLLAAAAAIALPAVTLPALEQAQVDAPMLAWFAAGSLFLLRSARGAPRAELVLAGCALGLAFGTKWYAVPDVLVVLALWTVVRLRRGGGLGQRLRPGGLLIGLVTAAGGFWLLRNWIVAGNPVHPAPVEPFGLEIFDAPPDPVREASGFTVWDYLFDLGAWRDHLLPAYRDHLGPMAALLLASAAATALVSLRVRAERAAAAGMLAVAALAMAALYVKLPDTAFGPPGNPTLVGANSRYLVPALLAAAPCAAWLAGRAGRARPLALLLLLGVIGFGLARCFPGLGAGDVARGLVGVGGLGLAGWAGLRLRPAVAGRPAAITACAAAAAVAFAGVGWKLLERYPAEPYGGADPVIAALTSEHGGAARVAIAGKWAPRGVSPVLPAFGRRLDNQVDYMGRFVRGTLREWDRRDPFVSQLVRGRYDAIVIGRGVPPTARGEQPEATWAAAAGYRERARSNRLVLLTR